MKLYTYPGAPNPRRVHIYLAEKGLSVPFQTVDIMKRENRSPEFMEKINPTGGIPVLELDDGSHIAESISICRYFEALHPEPALFGRGATQQAVVDMWLRRIELGLMSAVGLVWINGSPLTRAVVKQQFPEVAEQYREVAQRQLGLLDAQLAKQTFIAGDDYTIADIVALTTLDFAGRFLQLVPAPELTHLARWHKTVSSRPSASA